jgi:hypothetical protein
VKYLDSSCHALFWYPFSFLSCGFILVGPPPVGMLSVYERANGEKKFILEEKGKAMQVCFD